MNYSDFKITLDIQKVTSQAMIPVKKGDSARRIIVSLVENGKPYRITDECYAVFSATKPDGETLYNHCYINNNQIIYNITPQTTAVEGLVNANIILYGSDNEIIASPRFTILVDETVCSAEELTSTSEYSALADLVSKCQELLNADGGDEEGGEGGSGQNISGEVAIEDLLLGLSYAAEDTQLKYLSNAEESIYSTLSVATGSCIIKTLGKIAESGTDEMIDGAITIYVIPRDHVWYDEYGHQGDLLMKKITPFYDMYGLQYQYSEISNDINIENFIDDSGGYDDMIHPNDVPTVGAVIRYVTNAVGSSGGGASAEWQTIYTTNGEAVYYDDSSPLEVTGFSCTELRGMFNVKGSWDAVADDLKTAKIVLNDNIELSIVDLCGELTYDATDVLLNISVVSFGKTNYLEIKLQRMPTDDEISDASSYDGSLPSPGIRNYVAYLPENAITSFKITSSYSCYDVWHYDHNTKLELQCR